MKSENVNVNVNNNVNVNFNKIAQGLCENTTDCCQAYPCYKLEDFNIEAYAKCQDYYNTKEVLHSPFPLVITTWCNGIHSLNKDAAYKTYNANNIFPEFDAEFPDIITIPDRATLYQLLKDLHILAADIITNEFPFIGDNADLNDIIDLIHFIKEYDFITNYSH